MKLMLDGYFGEDIISSSYASLRVSIHVPSKVLITAHAFQAIHCSSSHRTSIA